MENSPNLALPYILAAQSQKHVTHNEAIRALDAIVQLAALDRDLTAPPVSPAEGDRYIVAAVATGAWTGHAGEIAAFQDGAWEFYAPVEGWLAWVMDENKLCAWDGAAWTAVADQQTASVNPTPLVGVNTTADTTNRLAVAGPASLFTHDGAGHQHKINKAASPHTASLLFQTAFTGRAELGTAGDDDFHVKVSADGSTWKEALVIDRNTGEVSFPHTVLDTGGSATSAVYNPHLHRAWAKIGEMYRRTTNERLTLVALGDSISPSLVDTLFTRLKVEHGNGGIAGYLNGMNGFVDDGAGTATELSWLTGDAAAFSTSPIGAYWRFQAGQSKYWSIVNSDGDAPLAYEHPGAFKPSPNTSRFGLTYVRRSGGGVVKVQIARGVTTTLFDVPGLTAIDTNGALGVQYVETSFPAWSAGSTYAVGDWVIFDDKAWRCGTATTAGQSPATTPSSWLEMGSTWRISLSHVSGGDVHVLGALVGASRGVIGHGWLYGGIGMASVVESPRFAELAALIKADLVVSRYIDEPGDARPLPAINAGWTPAQMATHAMSGVRAAFPATTVPVSTAPWAGKTALAPRKPHFVWFGPSEVEYSGYDGVAQAAAMKGNALAAGDCYVDTAAIYGVWRNAWDYGLYNGADGAGQSVHTRRIFEAALFTAFLRDTGLVGGTLMKPVADQRMDRLTVGPGTPATQAELGFQNRSSRAKIGDAANNVSFGPADDAQYPDFGVKVYGSAGTWSAFTMWDASGAGGERYASGSRPGAGYELRDMTDAKVILNHDTSNRLWICPTAGQTVALGPDGAQMSGIRFGKATLVAGTVTVTDAKVTANSIITVTRSARGGTVGTTYEAVPGAGSFVITARKSDDSVASTDTSIVSYLVVAP